MGLARGRGGAANVRGWAMIAEAGAREQSRLTVGRCDAVGGGWTPDSITFF